MSFGRSAIIATNLINEKKLNPVDAWEKAVVKMFPGSKSNQQKGCPKNTFLGLCENGYVKGVNEGKYTRSKLNKRYGITALNILQLNKTNVFSKSQLWKKVLENEGVTNKYHNSQMDVVLALWNEQLIRGS